MCDTLKAFIRHASTITKVGVSGSVRACGDIGEVIDEVVRSYQVVMRDSTQIQVFYDETGEKAGGAPHPCRVHRRKKFPIPHKKLNTRGIGKQFFMLQAISNNSPMSQKHNRTVNTPSINDSPEPLRGRSGLCYIFSRCWMPSRQSRFMACSNSLMLMIFTVIVFSNFSIRFPRAAFRWESSETLT